MNLSQSLKAAYDTISKKEYWCQHASARDISGIAVDPNNPTAYSWCAVGALDANSNDDTFGQGLKLLNRVAKAMGYEDVVYLNDSPNAYPKVLRMYEQAIDIALAKESST